MSTYDLFSFTEIISKDFMELAQQIEATLVSQPQAALMQTRLYNEQLVKVISNNEGLEEVYPLKHVERVHKLYKQNAIEEDIYLKMEWLRKKGNKAAHDVKDVSQQDAFQAHRFIYEISVWYIQIYINYDFEEPVYQLPLADKTMEVKQEQIDLVMKPFVDEALKKIDSMWGEVNKELEELKREKERLQVQGDAKKIEMKREENNDYAKQEEFPLLVFLGEHNLKYIDKRDKKGALWVLGDWSLRETLFTLKKNKIYFRFSKKGSKSTDYRPAWFLLNKTLTGTKSANNTTKDKSLKKDIVTSEEKEKLVTGKEEKPEVLTLKPVTQEFWFHKSQLSIPKHLLEKSLEKWMQEGVMLLRDRYGVKQFDDLNDKVLRKIYQSSQSDFHKVVNDLFMIGIRFSDKLKQFEPYHYEENGEIISVRRDVFEVFLSKKLPFHLDVKLKNRHISRMVDLDGMLTSSLWAILKEEFYSVMGFLRKEDVQTEDRSISDNETNSEKLLTVRYKDNNLVLKVDRCIGELEIRGCDHLIGELSRIGIHKLSDFKKPLDSIHESLIGVGPKAVQKFWDQLFINSNPVLNAEEDLTNQNGERLLKWNGQSIAILHEVKDCELSANDFPGSEKAILKMHEEGIKAIDDLPSDFLELKKIKGIGRKKIHSIFNKLNLLIPVLKEQIQIENLSSEERFEYELNQSNKWINNILNSEQVAKKEKISDRYVEIMKKRFEASLNEQHLTLETLGEQVGVTRERIRQIIAKGDQRIAVLLSSLTSLLKVKIEQNDLLINRWFKSNSFAHYLIRAALEQVDIYTRRLGNIEVLTSKTKQEMENFVEEIESDVEIYFDLHVITYTELKNFSLERAEEEGIDQRIVTNIANEMINWLSEEQGVLKKTTKNKVVEMVMLQYPEGVEIYKREVELNDKANILMPGSFEKERSFTSVIQRDEMKDKTLLWGRGVFIHERFVSVDCEWLRKVTQYVEKVVEIEDFIHVLKLYKEFEDEALVRNIPNEYALYTLLRANEGSSLNLDRFPLILNSEGSRLGNAQYIREFIKKKNRPVTMEELRNHFVQKGGWKHFTLEFTLSNTPDIIVSNWGEYALISFYDHIKPSDVESVINHIEARLKESLFVHIKAVFDEYKLVLESKGITSRYELYNVLKQLNIDGMEFRRYPYVFNPVCEFDRFSATKLIESYIKEEQDIVPREDIEQWSFEIFGEEDRILDVALVQSDDILYYSRGRYGEYIYKGYVLTETFDKKVLLDEVRFHSDNICHEWNRKYVFLPEIFDKLQLSLPLILDTISWSKELLGDIMKKSNEWTLIGSYNEIIVDTDSSIKNNIDFIEHILNEQFNGAAKLKDLKDYLIAIKYSANGHLLNDVEEALNIGKAPFIVQDDEIIHLNLVGGAK
ncbi:sigma factor-like helix-turn-helix DNA-binding protein [Oceanobacillus massiliensis]|uniref:sigma factor-like helix-turn-helix DNA-binding protein n=1 Tax=Oceanobacillus massiliensis TaxID=1465765 RepID=UPI0030169D74